MKLKITTMIAASLLFTGCAATTPVAPTLEYSNDEPYVWDDSKSLGLNITKAALEIPDDIRDSDIPQGESITRTGGWRDTAAATNLLANGLAGLAMSELIFGGDQTAWMPTYIWLEEIADQDLPTKGSDYKSVVDAFRTKFISMLQPINEAEFVGAYTKAITPNEWGASYIFVGGDYCDSNKEGISTATQLDSYSYPDIYQGQVSFDGTACLIPLRVNPVKQLQKDGKFFNVYSVSAGAFFSYLINISMHFDGYFSHPARAKELAGSYYGLDYPFVIHDGELHPFITPSK